MFGSLLKQCRQRAADLRGETAMVTKQREAIGAGAMRDKRALTDAERKEFLALGERADKLRDDALANDQALAKAEAANEAERLGEPIVDADALAGQRAAARAGIVTHHADFGGTSAADRPSNPRFAAMFPRAALSMDGWASATEFCGVVGRGLHDGRLHAASMTGDVASEGGFAIPPAIFGPWLDRALEGEIIRPRAAVWPMTTPERRVPAWDITDRSNGIAGLAINWMGQAPVNDATLQVAKMRLISLKARKGAIFAEASNELVADGYDFDAQLNGIMSGALGYGLDQSFFFGSGAECPLGIYSSSARIDVARTSSNLIQYEDLLNMFARMSPASIPNSIWVAHSSTIPMLATLSFAIGTGGASVPVMTESDGKFRILTREVVFTEKAKPLGQLGDIGLFDFSQYVIGMRAEAALEKSAHVGFLRDVATFRLLIRVDGMPNISAPYQPPNSAATQSPFVALAA